ncbi:hypothetical protein BS50DRAFT_504095 [Corynespora cassiicola Philippines]|uniref:Copper transport protein n=1 Tax=Corynespora cassiicola Philippines TaxID=1448308 RepID=A0A2T2N8L7_CORCC|nr:hypothetical protein BS50DRAFT_504095 [Corynespora cassiicola Philippines]
MSGMSSTFSFDTHVTLFFTEWTTTTPAAYIFTVIFLFFLGIFNRFLGALRSQLERRWKENQSKSQNQIQQGMAELRKRPTTIQGHIRSWSRQLNPKTSRLDGDEEESEPLSPAPPGLPVHTADKDASVSQAKFWIPSGVWSVKKDGIRAMLEFSRALIGYILMLAVMTYNVGFFFAVTGSVLLGEFIFGRYTQGGSKWQEGGCHE